MTELSIPWPGKTVGDAGPYTSEQWRELWEAGLEIPQDAGFLYPFFPIVSGTPTPISVAPANTDVRAFAFGRYYETDETESLAVSTPAGSTRFDLIVLRQDWALQTTRYAVRQGVEGAGIAPDPVQLLGSTYEIPVSEIEVTTGGAITHRPRLQFVNIGGLLRPENAVDLIEDWAGAAIVGALIHGQLLWDFALTGTAGITMTAVTADRVGEIAVATGATINSTAHWNLAGGAAGHFDGHWDFDYVLRILAGATVETEWAIGLRNVTVALDTTDGIYFRVDSGAGAANIFGVVRKDGSETIIDLGVNGSSELTLAFRKHRDSVQFYVNGVETGAAVTADIPVAGDFLTHAGYLENTSGVDRSIVIDFQACRLFGLAESRGANRSRLRNA